MNIVFDLIYNFSILISISIISGFIGHRDNNDWKRSLLQGVIFGSASVIGMLHPLVVAPGLIFDGRSVMISLAGLFFGPLASVIAALIALVLRINQGGTGVIMGTSVIISSAGIGTILNIRNRRKNFKLTKGSLFLMGIIVHIVMILLMFTLPDGRDIDTIKLMGIPVLLIYPIATVVIGRILLEANERRRIVNELRESKIDLISSNQKLNSSMEELVAIEEELRSQFEKLAVSNELLTASEEKYRMITENASDVISVYNLTKRKFSYVSPSMFYLRGFTAEEAMNERIEEAIMPESLEAVEGIIAKTMNDFIKNPNTPNYNIIEIQQPCKNGDIIWVELSTKYKYNSEGDIETVGVSRNIEERKRAEMEILFLSYHDQLTGLYNRRFYEEELKRMDVKRNLPLTIVMGDVNGLKLINDSFGHAMGDELLKKVAKAISKGCRTDDIIARLGGDEFAIILPNTDAFETEKIIKHIKDMALKEKVGSFDLSISFGYETKISEEEKIQEILKITEDHMYRHKLYESSSMRNKTIDLIMNTLYEKSNREMLHSKRVSKSCEAIATMLNFDKDNINKIRIAGLMHDIGKMGIDEKILNKDQGLNKDEWSEIKRHPEIGYRILSSVNEFSEIANYVLEHQERWDGKGYPKGLKEKEISLQARIIAVADAYDAMTCNRSYRIALPEEVAIKELQKNASVQFDPELVNIFIEKVLGK